MGPGIVLVAVLLFALVACGVMVVLSLKKVPPWAQMVVYRFGKTGADLVRGPGLRFILPFIDHAELVDMREQLVKLPRQTVLTSDRTARGIECQIRFKVVDALTSSITVANLRGAITGVAATELRAIVSRTHSSDLAPKRVLMAEELHVKLGQVVALWGGQILRVEIGEIGSPNIASLGDPTVAR
jgi:regulator of protease activity HflC (stomatin/prohibitin superfamily)